MFMPYDLDRSNPVFSSLKILKLDNMVNFQSIGNLLKKHFSKKNNVSVNPHGTRSVELLHIPKIDTVKYVTG